MKSIGNMKNSSEGVQCPGAGRCGAAKGLLHDGWRIERAGSAASGAQSSHSFEGGSMAANAIEVALVSEGWTSNHPDPEPSCTQPAR